MVIVPTKSDCLLDYEKSNKRVVLKQGWKFIKVEGNMEFHIKTRHEKWERGRTTNGHVFFFTDAEMNRYKKLDCNIAELRKKINFFSIFDITNLDKVSEMISILEKFKQV